MALTRVYGNLITSGTITGSLFQANTLTGDIIGQSAVSTNNISTGAITADKVAIGTLTGNLLSPSITTPNLNFGGSTTFLNSTLESANVTTLLGANTTINISQPLVVFTANSSANSTVNFTGLSGIPVGNTASFVIINPNGASAKYINGYQVDGSAVTPKWQGGLPIGGTSANTDIYNFSIIKTSSTPTYNIFASVASYY